MPGALRGGGSGSFFDTVAHEGADYATVTGAVGGEERHDAGSRIAGALRYACLGIVNRTNRLGR